MKDKYENAVRSSDGKVESFILKIGGYLKWTLTKVQSGLAEKE